MSRTEPVKVGGVYWTKVSGQRVQVLVVADEGGRGRRYRVVRVRGGNALVRLALRAATALHDKPGPW